LHAPARLPAQPPRNAVSLLMEGAPPKAFSLMMERRRVKRLAVPEDAIEGDASATPNAFSLMMERWRVKHPAEREDATEYDASATLSRTLEDYGLPPPELQKSRVRGLKPKVPEEELTHVQKMRRKGNESKSEKRREGGLWDPNVDGGGILQSGSAIRY